MEGSRFGMCICELAYFVAARGTTGTRENKRLPRITQRDVFRSVLTIDFRKTDRDATRWVIPGSRLLGTCFGQTSAGIK
jgi:hypothetical protein